MKPGLTLQSQEDQGRGRPSAVVGELPMLIPPGGIQRRRGCRWEDIPSLTHPGPIVMHL